MTITKVNKKLQLLFVLFLGNFNNFYTVESSINIIHEECQNNQCSNIGYECIINEPAFKLTENNLLPSKNLNEISHNINSIIYELEESIKKNSNSKKSRYEDYQKQLECAKNFKQYFTNIYMNKFYNETYYVNEEDLKLNPINFDFKIREPSQDKINEWYKNVNIIHKPNLELVNKFIMGLKFLNENDNKLENINIKYDLTNESNDNFAKNVELFLIKLSTQAPKNTIFFKQMQFCMFLLQSIENKANNVKENHNKQQINELYHTMEKVYKIMKTIDYSNNKLSIKKYFNKSDFKTIESEQIKDNVSLQISYIKNMTKNFNKILDKIITNFSQRENFIHGRTDLDKNIINDITEKEFQEKIKFINDLFFALLKKEVNISKDLVKKIIFNMIEINTGHLLKESTSLIKKHFFNQALDSAFKFLLLHIEPNETNYNNLINFYDYLKKYNEIISEDLLKKISDKKLSLEETNLAAIINNFIKNNELSSQKILNYFSNKFDSLKIFDKISNISEKINNTQDYFFLQWHCLTENKSIEPSMHLSTDSLNKISLLNINYGQNFINLCDFFYQKPIYVNLDKKNKFDPWGFAQKINTFIIGENNGFLYKHNVTYYDVLKNEIDNNHLQQLINKKNRNYQVQKDQLDELLSNDQLRNKFIKEINQTIKNNLKNNFDIKSLTVVKNFIENEFFNFKNQKISKDNSLINLIRIFQIRLTAEPLNETQIFQDLIAKSDNCISENGILKSISIKDHTLKEKSTVEQIRFNEKVTESIKLYKKLILKIIKQMNTVELLFKKVYDKKKEETKQLFNKHKPQIIKDLAKIMIEISNKANNTLFTSNDNIKNQFIPLIFRNLWTEKETAELSDNIQTLKKESESKKNSTHIMTQEINNTSSEKLNLFENLVEKIQEDSEIYDINHFIIYKYIKLINNVNNLMNNINEYEYLNANEENLYSNYVQPYLSSVNLHTFNEQAMINFNQSLISVIRKNQIYEFHFNSNNFKFDEKFLTINHEKQDDISATIYLDNYKKVYYTEIKGIAKYDQSFLRTHSLLNYKNNNLHLTVDKYRALNFLKDQPINHISYILEKYYKFFYKSANNHSNKINEFFEVTLKKFFSNLYEDTTNNKKNLLINLYKDPIFNDLKTIFLNLDYSLDTDNNKLYNNITKNVNALLENKMNMNNFIMINNGRELIVNEYYDNENQEKTISKIEYIHKLISNNHISRIYKFISHFCNQYENFPSAMEALTTHQTLEREINLFLHFAEENHDYKRLILFRNIYNNPDTNQSLEYPMESINKIRLSDIKLSMEYINNNFNKFKNFYNEYFKKSVIENVNDMNHPIYRNEDALKIFERLNIEHYFKYIHKLKNVLFLVFLRLMNNSQSNAIIKDITLDHLQLNKENTLETQNIEAIISREYLTMIKDHTSLFHKENVADSISKDSIISLMKLLIDINVIEMDFILNYLYKIDKKIPLLNQDVQYYKYRNFLKNSIMKKLKNDLQKESFNESFLHFNLIQLLDSMSYLILGTKMNHSDSCYLNEPESLGLVNKIKIYFTNNMKTKQEVKDLSQTLNEIIARTNS